MIGHEVIAQPAAAATDRLRAWIDGVPPRVIESAARRAPATLTARLEEEWLADLLARHGPVSRMSFALGCLWAAAAISWDGDTVATAATSSQGITTAVATHRLYHGPRPLPRRTISTTEGTLLCDINTTPLIDVMLVLLITLILTLPLMTHAVKLDLTQALPLAEDARPETIDLAIDFDGTIRWNGVTLAGWEQLDSYLRSEAQKTPQPQIHLRADRRARYGAVARVLAAAQRNRMQHIGLVDTAKFED